MFFQTRSNSMVRGNDVSFLLFCSLPDSFLKSIFLFLQQVTFCSSQIAGGLLINRKASFVSLSLQIADVFALFNEFFHEKLSLM